MQVDVARAHAETLIEWSRQWSDGALAGDSKSEVVFLMRRAARQMAKVAGFSLKEDFDALREPGAIENVSCGGGESGRGEETRPKAICSEEVREG